MTVKRALGILLVMIGTNGSARTSSVDLEKFVDELPIPSRLTYDGAGPFNQTITLDRFVTKVHRDLPETAVWGYNGSSPGPTIEVQRGQALSVHWRNQLDPVHVLPLPEGADHVEPDVRSVTHLHGAVVTETEPMNREHNNDGWPDAWIVPGQEQQADYPNDQSARLLWYHDHAMGSTGRNVAAGLTGMYIIRDDYERSLNLPSGAFEIPMILTNKEVNDDGTLGYTPEIAKEFFGNVNVVNGKIWPFVNVEPRKYRFRIVNGSNARSYGLKLLDTEAGTDGPPIHQIGSDGGFLAKAVILNDPATPGSPRLVLAPSERADVIIDFSAFAGRALLLHNNSKDPSDDEIRIAEVVQFRVAAAVSAPDTSSLPTTMRPIVRLVPEDAVKTRRIVFDQMDMGDGSTMLVLNGKHWHDPIEEQPVLGTTEVWELTNTLFDPHPFHIHLVQFQVLDRRLFDVAAFLATGRVNFLADPVPPAANEMGWKDTVRVLPQMITRIIMRFAPYPGYYVYHCHILEHEDMDMMRPFQILEPQSSTPIVDPPIVDPQIVDPQIVDDDTASSF